ncbi:hypothetical protein [Heyndrickxia ginsengihumi]|nr:hypothetical protein [Heyndrickxia ginsengihumi]
MNKWKTRIGYGVGDLGCNLVFSTMASYLMFFIQMSLALPQLLQAL